eukprot:9109673-Alexandrium_andersonii.AAC.1
MWSGWRPRLRRRRAWRLGGGQRSLVMGLGHACGAGACLACAHQPGWRRESVPACAVRLWTLRVVEANPTVYHTKAELMEMICTVDPKYTRFGAGGV